MIFRRSKLKGGRRSPGKGALVMVAALLISSAALRMGESAGQALALAPEEMMVSELDPVPMQAACSAPEDLEPMLAAFQKREARIAEQENAIRNRLQALRVADEEIERKLAALTQAENDLRETIALADTAAEGDLARLTKVYETMKPKQAAALFEEMDPEFAAGFLGRMRPDAAAAIMAGLTPAAAHSFSVVLAGRNAEVPKE
ncbi:MotE family protein [Roseovarius sp. 2305UL8-3]|uniref:MotE family protein n=1 Tax=Roseovarius conchicola TaxID=3121636 RepID=UPI003529A18D